MAPKVSSWANSTNEIFIVELVSPDEDGIHVCSRFHPELTYPFYGEDEMISGYLKPQVRLCLSAKNLTPYLSSSFQARSSSVTNSLIPQSLLDVLPENLIQDKEEFIRTIRAKEQQIESPPGILISSFNPNDKNFGCYEFYACNFSDAKFRLLYSNMKILPMFFIEGAVPLDENDMRWVFIVAYQRNILKKNNSYLFSGMMSIYHYYMFPEHERWRISQLLVLPSHRRRGIGAEMYDCAHKMALKKTNVVQLAIEDPSDIMDAIRDIVDLGSVYFGIKNGSLQLNLLEPPLGLTEFSKKEGIKCIRNNLKLHPRQAERVYEMWSLLKLKTTNQMEKPPTEFRLMVKNRLYRYNVEPLKDLTALELKSRLNDTYNLVLEEYLERLAVFSSKYNL